MLSPASHAAKGWRRGLKQHIVLRRIDGVVYRCIDVGCDDFDKAAASRSRAAKREAIVGYVEAETSVTKTPLTTCLSEFAPSKSCLLVKLVGKDGADSEKQAILTAYRGDMVDLIGEAAI